MKVQKSVSFDLNKQQEILKLLGFVRGSAISQDEKNAIRDLVLNYTRSHDAEVLISLNVLLTKINVEITGGKLAEVVQSETMPESSKPIKQNTGQSAEQKTNSGIGVTRPQPLFGGTTATPVESAKIEKIPEALETEQATEAEVRKLTVKQTVKPEMEAGPKVPQTTPSPGQLVTKVPAPDQFPPVLESTSVAESSQVAQPDVPVSPVQSDIDSKTQEQVETTVPTAPISLSASATPENMLKRIKEIKRIVNEKVGNPVNLIDSNNSIGREYMNALLNAMKIMNGGSKEDTVHSMERLEKAFQAVKKTVVAKPKENNKPFHTHQHTITQAPKEDESVQFPIASEPTAVATIPSVPSPLHTETTILEVDTGMKPTHSQAVIPESKDGVSQTQAEVQAKEQKLPTTGQISQKPPLSQLGYKPSPESLGEDSAFRSPEITSGLGQLLSEWKLFKSSGIFGTGPSGVDHPLYKKVSGLTMSALMAGRFEGATPEIKQSISDYMNGWRYEQGVLHQHSETFEHYLRRVIKTIIERQKQKTNA